MSDTRRRRKQSGGSDDLSDSYDELNATKETQSSEQTDARRDSEYDTAGSDGDSDGGSQDGGERESGDGQEEDKPQKKLDDDEDRRNPQYVPKRGTFYEHDDRTSKEAEEVTEEPVPERETKEKKVWKDKEDRWNHDRYNDDEQAPKSHEELMAVYGYDIRNEEGPPRARRRRRYGRGPNKYTRNWEDEDAYGKTAGSVSITGGGKNTGRRNNRSGEEFPALGGTNKEASTESMDEPVISSAWYSNKNKTQSKQQNFPPLQSQQENHKSKSASSNSALTPNENRAPNEPNNPAWKKEPKAVTRNASPNRNAAGGGAGSDTDKFINNTQISSSRDAKDPRKRQVHESVSLVANRARGRGYKPGANNNLVAHRTPDSKPKGRGPGLISVEPRRNNATSHRDDDLPQQQQQLGADIKHQTPNDGSYNPGGRQTKNFHAPSPIQQRPNAVPPRMQQQQQPSLSQAQQQVHPPQQQQQQQQLQQQQADVTGNRPKRYSSLRQRPTIPEGPTQPQPPYPPQHPQHGFYPPQAGNSHGVLESQGFPQAHFEQPAPVGNSGAPMPGQPVIPLAPGGQPAGYAPPPFLVPPPQFISPQAAPPNIINYVPTPAGPPFQPNFQGYQGYNPTVQPQGPPPPPELFQPQGCTYYSPAQQQQQQAPLRRPKAAIPILPPPDTSSAQQYHQGSRGRGRTPQNVHPTGIPGNASSQPAASPPQHQENEEPAPPAPSHEPEIKNDPEIFENERFEEHPAPSASSPQCETAPPAASAAPAPTNQPESEATAAVPAVATEPEPEPAAIPCAPTENITKVSPAEIPEPQQQQQTVLPAKTEPKEEEPQPEPATIENQLEAVDATVVAIVAPNLNPSAKTVELNVTITEQKISEPEKNVVLVEKPVVEETAA